MRYGFDTIDAPAWKRNGKPSATKLRQKNVVAGYLLVVSFPLVVATAVLTSYYSNGLYRFLRLVKFNVNKNDRQSYDGQWLEAYLAIMGPRAEGPVGQYDSDGITSTAIGTKALVGRYMLPMQMLHTYTPEAFGLPTENVDHPTLEITLGDETDLCVTGGGGTAVITDAAATIDLYEIPYDDPGVPATSFAGVRIEQYEIAVAQSGKPKVQMDSLGLGDELRGVFIQAYQDGIPDDTVVTNILGFDVNNEERWGTTPWKIAQVRNKSAYNRAALWAGLVIIDAAENRRTESGQLWTVTTKSPPVLEIQTVKGAGVCTVKVTVLYRNTSGSRR